MKIVIYDIFVRSFIFAYFIPIIDCFNVPQL